MWAAARTWLETAIDERLASIQSAEMGAIAQELELGSSDDGLAPAEGLELDLDLDVLTQGAEVAKGIWPLPKYASASGPVCCGHGLGLSHEMHA